MGRGGMATEVAPLRLKALGSFHLFLILWEATEKCLSMACERGAASGDAPFQMLTGVIVTS